MAKKKTFIKKKSSGEELLDYAKGVKPIEEIMEVKFWDKQPGQVENYERYRREARRAIFKIIKYMKLKKPYKDDPKLKEMYDMMCPLLDSNLGLRWDNFTQRWDLHPKDITKIVLREHWFKEGGGVDVELGRFAPTAFTDQKL